MTSWQEITQQGLLGTGRRPDVALDDRSAVGALVGRLPADRSPAQRLLIAAGALAQYDTVGQHLPTLPADWITPPPAEDPRPICPADPAEHLTAILNGAQQRDLLPEFLDCLAQKQMRVPDRLLPILLTAGFRSARLQADVLKAIGPRGRWVAAQGGESWAYATLDLSDWQDLLARYRTGKIAKRVTLLKLVRSFDPHLGRDLIQATWKAEGDLHRSQILTTMNVGLNAADEPFLETVLDDRTATVRKKAAELLSKIPESAYAKRMGRYLSEILLFKKRLVHKPTFDVNFPKEPTAEMTRNGIEHPSVRKRNPSRYISDMLSLIVQATPLDVWESSFSQPRATLLNAVEESGWSRTLAVGLYKATINQKNAAWAAALFEFEKTHSTLTQNRLNMGKLAAVLPEPEALAVFDQLVESWGEREIDRHNPLRTFWKEWPHTWTDDFTFKNAEVMGKLLASMSTDGRPDATIRATTKLFFRTCPPEHAEPIFELITAQGLNDEQLRLTHNWITGLNFRLKFHEALHGAAS